MKIKQLCPCLAIIALALSVTSCTNPQATNPDNGNRKEETTAIQTQNNTIAEETTESETETETNAESGYSQGLKYEKQDDGTYYVSGIGTCTDTFLRIPPVYEGAAVTGIRRLAFASNRANNATGVVIPDSVISIGEAAFSACYNLQSVIIPGSVEVIDSGAFRGCMSLTDVTISEGVEILGKSVFSDCTALTSITIPNSVTKIEDDLFRDCKALTTVTFGNGLTELPSDTFLRCSSLTSVKFPDQHRFRCFYRLHLPYLHHPPRGSDRYRKLRLLLLLLLVLHHIPCQLAKRW